MKIAICIIARNEAGTIGALMAQLGAQTLLARSHRFQLVVVANACADITAIAAREAMQTQLSGLPVEGLIHETPLGGKARSWNLAVHELIAPDAEIGLFLDADIELTDTDVLADLLERLTSEPALLAVSGHPVKDIVKKPKKTPVDRFSLIISRQSPTPHAINGSLYAARMNVLRRIWLPVPTPGEDGLLSAMIHTDGFSRPARTGIIAQISRPTHYFEAHSILGYFRHETRMIVGTVVNGWLCEFLWAGGYKENASPLVRDRNEQDPGWVGRLVQSRAAGRRWVLPPRMLTWRLHNLRGIGAARMLMRAPFSIAATILNLWPAYQANKRLKRCDAADFW